MIGIYKIVNKINNKVYIGQSININRRIKEHFWKAQCEKDVSYNSALHSAIRKYGKENFKWEVIEECEIEEIDEKEKYYIQFYNSLTPNGYNILEGGQKFRAESNRCKKCGTIISKNTKNNLCRECYIQSLRKDRPTVEELKQILLDNNGNFTKVGKLFGVTDNSIRKWCKNYDLPTHSSDYKPKKEKLPCKIAVNQIDIETGQIIQTFESAMAAARFLGKSKGSHITEVCKDKCKTAYGYKWEYTK